MATVKHIHMGTITRPHGIKGELCVDWYADSPKLLQKTFFLQVGNNPLQCIKNAKFRMHKGRPLLTLPHIHDRNMAESLRGACIFVERDALPPLPDYEAYLSDIIGMDIFDYESHSHIGILEAVEFPKSQILWVIRNRDGQEILLPAVEEFIMSFDLETRQIFVSPPKGLLELYLSNKDD